MEEQRKRRRAAGEGWSTRLALILLLALLGSALVIGLKYLGDGDESTGQTPIVTTTLPAEQG
jgi:hypothetical protein